MVVHFIIHSDGTKEERGCGNPHDGVGCCRKENLNHMKKSGKKQSTVVVALEQKCKKESRMKPACEAELQGFIADKVANSSGTISKEIRFEDVQFFRCHWH